MRKLLLFTAVVGLLYSCAATKKTTLSSAAQPTLLSAETTQDGLSYETAIVIDESNENSGVAKEYEWLKEHYPGYKMNKQSLKYYNKRAYDILSITTADGTKKDIYFDIMKFYGKF